MNKEKCMSACNAVLDLLGKDFDIGVGWLEMLNVIAGGCVTIPQVQEPQKFDPEAKSISFGLNTFSIRIDIERLRRDARIADPTLSSLLSRLIDIVDRLEQRPPSIINLQTTPNPVIFPTIAPPQSFPFQPYPNYPGGGTVCISKAQSVNGPNNLESTGQSVGSVSDATGTSDPFHPASSDEEIPF